jgi:hypothetical protein
MDQVRDDSEKTSSRKLRKQLSGIHLVHALNPRQSEPLIHRPGKSVRRRRVHPKVHGWFYQFEFHHGKVIRIVPD